MGAKFYEENPAFQNRVIAETESGEKYTYHDLNQFSLSMAQAVEPRKTVFVICEQNMATLFGIVSFLRNQTVMFLFHNKLPKENMDALFLEYQPNYLYVLERKIENYPGFRVLQVQYGMALLMNEKVQLPPVKQKKLALFLSTSGSTGHSKLVRLSYDNLDAATRKSVEAGNITKNSITGTFLPMEFAYGLAVIMSHIRVGAKIIITKKSVTQNSFWRMCEDKHITFFFGVPYMYENICKLGIESYLSRFQTISVAGGKLKHAVSERCTQIAFEHHILFVNEYGQTEAPCMSFQIKSGQEVCDMEENIGTPVVEGRLYLLDANHNPITKSGIAGNLYYEGKTVGMGYCFSRDEVDREDSWNGVCNTGDIAVLNAKGTIEIVGRAKRFIKLYGKRYSLDHLEYIMNQEISEGQVVTSGIDDMLVIFTDCEKNMETCKVYLHRKYGISADNYRVVYQKEFPLNENGKIAYAKLLEFVKETYA